MSAQHAGSGSRAAGREVMWGRRDDRISAPTDPLRDPERTVSPTHICCGQRLRRHAVEPRESELSFTYCSRCESLQWFREDLPIADQPSGVERLAGLTAGGDLGVPAQS
jgi:hypothetical protein